MTQSIHASHSAGSRGVEKTVKDQEHRKNYVGWTNQQLRAIQLWENRPMDGPGNNGKYQIPAEPSQEKLNSERRVLGDAFSFPKQIRDKARGTVGHAGYPIAQSEDEALQLHNSSP
jgi:hypothetical protein